MMKFILAARRKPEDTQERYFYEWSIIHVALMITNPSTQRAFRRYAQHYTINGVSNDLLWHPLSPMAWDNMADHWLESFDDLIVSMRDIDYVQRMQPHKFGDSNFVVELTGGNVVFEQAGFQNGGVKLIHFLKKRTELSQAEFMRRWQDEHSQTVLRALQPLNILRKYVQNAPMPLDPSIFRGTLFEAGGVGQHAGIEEFWFESLEDLARLRNDRQAWERIRESDAQLTEASSFSMVATERVVFDYVTPGLQTPKAAVLTPGTLEALIDAQGYSGFNVPRPPGASAGRK
jgi:EthD domain-containing protein